MGRGAITCAYRQTGDNVNIVQLNNVEIIDNKVTIETDVLDRRPKTLYDVSCVGNLIAKGNIVINGYFPNHGWGDRFGHFENLLICDHNIPISTVEGSIVNTGVMILAKGSVFSFRQHASSAKVTYESTNDTETIANSAKITYTQSDDTSLNIRVVNITPKREVTIHCDIKNGDYFLCKGSNGSFTNIIGIRDSNKITWGASNRLDIKSEGNVLDLQINIC